MSAHSTRGLFLRHWLAGSCALLAVATAAPAGAETLFGLTFSGLLVRFDSATPGTVTTVGAITGLGIGESLLAIDFRPATGQLYAFSSNNNVYVINTTTATATAVGSPGALGTSSNIGFDFNPTVDRIRVTSDNDVNARVNPTNGSLTAVDSALTYQAGDPNFGISPSIVGSAYTNNFAGALTTSLYDIDYSLDILALQTNPNGGLLSTVGPLGFNVLTGEFVGFDVSGPTGIAYLSSAALVGHSSNLYTVNLTTGAATLIGTVGIASELRGLAAAVGAPVPEPGTWAMMLLGFGAIGAAVRQRRRAVPAAA